MKVDGSANVQYSSGSSPQKPKNPHLQPSGRPSGRKDTVSISGRSPKVKQLVSQKKSVRKRYDRLVRTTKQKGESLGTIRIKLMQYKQKLKSIDDQIARAVVEDAKKQMQQAIEKREDTRSPRPDAETQYMAKQAGNTAEMRLSQEVTAARSRLRGETRDAEDALRDAKRQDAPRREQEALRTKLEELKKKEKP